MRTICSSLSPRELLDEIEAIVFSGTKLKLDYYIEQALDDDVVDEIYDYFHDEAESDSLEDAMADLGSDSSYTSYYERKLYLGGELS